MAQLAKVTRADTSMAVNLANAAGKAYIPEAPTNGREYARRNGEWVDVTEEMAMARWFAITDRVITTATIPATIVSSSTPTNLEAVVRRVRVGNIYLYRVYVEGIAGEAISLDVGNYIVGTADDYPELTGYEYSYQMSVPVFKRTAVGALDIAGTTAGLIQPTGIIIHIATATTIPAGYSLLYEATRSQMGQWAS